MARERVVSIEGYSNITEFVENAYIHQSALIIIDENTKRNLGPIRITNLDFRLKRISFESTNKKRIVVLKQLQHVIIAAEKDGIYFQTTITSKGILKGRFQTTLPKRVIVKNRRLEDRYNFERLKMRIKVQRLAASDNLIGSKEIFKAYLQDVSENGISIKDPGKHMRVIDVGDKLRIISIEDIRLDSPVTVSVCINKRKLNFEGDYYQKVGSRFFTHKKGNDIIDVIKDFIKNKTE